MFDIPQIVARQLSVVALAPLTLLGRRATAILKK